MFTLKLFLLDYLTTEQVNQVFTGTLKLEDVLDAKVLSKYNNLEKWVNKSASLVRTNLSQ
jgi:hypothetical protein